MPAKKLYVNLPAADNTRVKKATKVTQDKFKGGLMEGSDLPVGMHSVGFEHENAMRERMEGMTKQKQKQKKKRSY